MAARDPYTEFRYSKNVSAKFDRHRQFFVTRLRCTDFLPDMTNVEGFDKDARSKIREKAKVSTSAEANEMFLETLRNSKGQGKWLIFIYVLDKLGYELLRELLTGEPDIEEIERSESFLEYLTPVIKAKFCPKQLLPYLVRDKYLDEVDKQAIECRSDNVGPISAAELLLTCVQRLRKDVCSGLWTAFRENQMLGVIEEMTRCSKEFLEKGERDEVFALSRLGLGGSFRKRSSLGSGGLSEEEEASSPPVAARCGSPTLCGPKALTLRDYQWELYSVVKRAKKTLILCPAKSGKRFVALKAIEEHLSLAHNPDGKVAYLVTNASLGHKVMRRCLVFLEDIPSVQIQTKSFDGHFSGVLSDNGVVIAEAKIFKKLLDEKLVKWSDFSMVILELGVDYYKERKYKNLYKQITESYHKVKASLPKAQLMPQILVLSDSVCGESPLENMFSTAMETCATFDIHAIAMVRNNIESLRQYVSVPLVERKPVPEKQELGFDKKINELMSRVEETMKKIFHSKKMPEDEHHPGRRRAEVVYPPADRTSVKYMTWLKSNRGSLGYGAKKHQCSRAASLLTCLRLATIYQSGLFINAECRRFDAVNYMRSNLNRLKENLTQPMSSDLRELFEDFYENETFLKSVSRRDEDDNSARIVKNKLEEIFGVSKSCKVAVLVKCSKVITRLKFYLKETLFPLKVECVVGHHQDYSVETARLFETGFDVLITTWPILAFHLGKEMRTWDYMIRTDCPGNDVITFARKGTPPTLSTQSENSPDLLMVSSIEKVALELAQQQQDSGGLYQTLLNDVQMASMERALWSRSTHSLRRLYDEMAGDFFCNGCGAFVCNRAHVRNLDDLWLGLDPGLIYRFSTIKHSSQIVFSNGYAKLGRFVCKECGEKWGIIVLVLGRTHLAFSKEGLDYLIDGRFQKYDGKWKYANIEVELFNYNHDLLRCLPSSFCVEGETIAELVSRLPKPVED